MMRFMLASVLVIAMGFAGVSVASSANVSTVQPVLASLTSKPLLLASATTQKRYASGRSFVFNPRLHRWYFYVNGRLVRSGVASGGASWCADIKRSCRTPSGTYRLISKGGPGCRSSRYPVGKGGAPMPYCMFFSKYYALHGSPHVSAKRNLSHGCVRLYPSDARWLSGHLHIGDTVRVTSY